MNYLIVDDEPLARKRLIQLLNNQNSKIMTFEAKNGKKALEILNKEEITTIFLDIRMPIMDGLEAAKHIYKLAKPPAIIFTTAYSEFALDAFDLNAIAYLLKPISQDKLNATLQKAVQLNAIQLQSLKNEPAIRSHLSSKIGAKLQLISIKEVSHFFCEDKYVMAVSGQNSYVIEETIKELEAEFENQFLRVHRSAIVNKAMITGLIKKDDKQFVTLQNEAEVEVSRRKLPSVRKQLKSC
jgi:two-component system response regulator AlgR